MIRVNRTAIGGALLVLAGATLPAVAQVGATRYVARLDNGARISGDELAGWHDRDTRPTLDGRPLFGEAAPLRWLLNQSVPQPDTPAAYVETQLGDRLPGRVTRYRNGVQPPPDAWRPPHLVVDTSADLKPPGNSPDRRIRIRVDAVRRVVWQPLPSGRFHPQTAFLRDGQRLAFRAVRWNSESLSLLTAEGPRQVAFSDLAQIHLRQAAPWDPWLRELAFFQTAAKDRWLQMEARSGLIATAPLKTLEFRTIGEAADPRRWVHGIQPWWSLDVLWVAHRDVATRRFWSADELPLSRATPQTVVQQSPFGGDDRPWRVNRNQQRGPLHTAGQPFGWGFGVHATAQMDFDLPHAARRFRSEVGLDRLAGTGGCVIASVALVIDRGRGDEVELLAESPPLIGSQRLFDTDWLPLKSDERAAGTAPARTLRLRIDMAHQQRPAGADPFDIRDIANWLDPLIRFDYGQLSTQWPAQELAAWTGWRIASDRTALSWRQFPEPSAGSPNSLRRAVATSQGELVLERDLPSRERPSWLILDVERADHLPDPGPKMSLLRNGQTVWSGAVQGAEPSRGGVAPLVVKLPKSGPERLAIRQEAAPRIPVIWNRIELRDLPPGLLRIAAVDPGGQSSTTETSPLTESPARRLPAGQSITASAAHPIKIRERPRWGEYRFLRYTVKHSRSGGSLVEVRHAFANQSEILLATGRANRSHPGARNVWPHPPTDAWMVVTQDLIHAFGPTELQELRIQNAGSDSPLLIGDIFLADSLESLDAMPGGEPADAINRAARRRTIGELAGQVRSRVGIVELPDGQFGAATVADNRGHLITAAHLVAGLSNGPTVVFAGERRLPAELLGIDRTRDLALLRVAAASLPAPQATERAGVPPQTRFATVCRVAPEGRPTLDFDLATIRRSGDQAIWTDLEMAGWTAGGPLFDHRGQLIGVLRERSQFGGLVFTPLTDLTALVRALTQPGARGVWAEPVAPRLGFETGTHQADNGWPIARVEPGVDLAEGDLVLAVAGQPIDAQYDWKQLGAESDPGRQIALRVRRGDETREVTIVLRRAR